MTKKPFSKVKESLEKGKKPKMSERQIIDKAVQDIHTDKKQVDEVLEGLSDELQQKILEELRRRGGDAYPERGPDGR